MPDPNVPLPERMPSGSDPEGPELAREVALLAVIAGALAASVLVYAGVGWFLTSEAMAAGFEPAGLPGSVSTALGVAGFALLLIAPVVERKLREASRGAAPAEAVAAFRRATVVGFALREAAALFGLLIAIFTGEPLWCFGLALAALVAMIAAWPSRGKLERFVRGAVAPT